MERTNPHLQVFISFRGKDVRDNILSSLKKKLKDEGVNVKTDDDMPKGTKIVENLLKLIRDSKVVWGSSRRTFQSLIGAWTS